MFSKYSMFAVDKLPQYRLDQIKVIALLLLIAFSSLSITLYMFMGKANYINNADNSALNAINLSATVTKANENLHIVNPPCNIFTCFDVYRCGNNGNQLLIYVYPEKDDIKLPKELKNNFLVNKFQHILRAIRASKYYTSNINNACIFVPSIDLLSLDNSHMHVSKKLEFSNKGKNHLIFNFIFEDIQYSKDIIKNTLSQAMIASFGYTKSLYRGRFDISLPILSDLVGNIQYNVNKLRKWFIVSSQLNVNPTVMKDLDEIKKLFPEELQIFDSCSHPNKTIRSFRCISNESYQYPELLQTSSFCLVLRGERLGLSILTEALASGCIPVIIFDSFVMPFDEVIDWSRAVVFIREVDILFTVDHLQKYSAQRIKELRDHGIWLYQKYFKSIKAITETTLDIITDRVFPHSAKNYYYWNEPEYTELGLPVFLPITSLKNDGFTAVILTYDRIDLLFLLIHKLSKVPSLAKILVIWNNEYKKPPRLSKWPKVNKLIKIIQTDKNVLSNRFYPFDEIETEAVLSIDDDIIMLTEDEIEFAFEVWREFPDRLVGFPSRTHAWDNNSACWKYESEWTNHISMVLTGAAFYHKYWNYAYTTQLPEDVKEWVDAHMNCEDIAMNFLISNITKKAPIKVTAKKKFRCPECINTEMLSADLTHMVERTQCINQFTKAFGNMPLVSVEFRADPVLFKDSFPNKLKRFNDVGSL